MSQSQYSIIVANLNVVLDALVSLPFLSTLALTDTSSPVMDHGHDGHGDNGGHGGMDMGPTCKMHMLWCVHTHSSRPLHLRLNRLHTGTPKSKILASSSGNGTYLRASSLPSPSWPSSSFRSGTSTSARISATSIVASHWRFPAARRAIRVR